MERQLKKTMSLGLSFAAREVKGGELLGVVIIDILNDKKDEDDDVADPDQGDFKCHDLPLKAKRLFRMFDHITTDGGKSSVFKATGANTAYDIFIISTSDKAKNRGVGTALFRRSMDECAKRSKQGKSVVQCMALSAYTIRICKKLGFNTLFK